MLAPMMPGGRAALARSAAAAAALVAGGLLALGCGGRDSGPNTELAAATPAGAVAYLEGVVRPEDEQQEAIEAIAARFPGGEDLKKRVITQLNRGFGEDIEEGSRPPTYAGDV